MNTTGTGGPREVRDPHQPLARARDLAESLGNAPAYTHVSVRVVALEIVTALEAEAQALDFIAERVTALELRIGGLARGDSHGERPAVAPTRPRDAA